MNIIEKLDPAIRAVCPIAGVSIGKPDDKGTWLVHFAPAATTEQRAAAAAVIAAFDVAAVQQQESQSQLRRATDQQELSDSRVDAAVLALLDMTPTQRVQWARTNFPTLTQPEATRLGMVLSMVAVAMRPQVRA